MHHAIQPAFRDYTPYLILLVDLDTQKGKPTADEALRVVGNLVTPDGKLAPPELVRTVGIGTRVRMVFSDAGAQRQVIPPHSSFILRAEGAGHPSSFLLHPLA